MAEWSRSDTGVHALPQLLTPLCALGPLPFSLSLFFFSFILFECMVFLFLFYLFLIFIYLVNLLFIFGCVGSSLLRAGFL